MRISLPTLIFLGGSAWTEKTLPVMDRLLANEAFLDRLNVIVVAGKNEAFETTLRARVGQAPRFSVFGFVDAKLMAELQAVADVPVLGSLAPASMQELLETRCGPLMLFHYIPGTEDAHVEHIREQEIGLFEPDPDAMVDLLMQATGFKPAASRWRGCFRLPQAGEGHPQRQCQRGRAVRELPRPCGPPSVPFAPAQSNARGRSCPSNR